MSSAVRERRRAEIVEAARSLVAEAGVEALTFGNLDKVVPFSRGVITYHFASKDDIVDAVLESALAEIDAATEAEVGDRAQLAERVQAVLRTKVHGFLAHPEATKVLLSFWVRATHDPRARQVNTRLFQTYRDQAARLVRSARRDVDADALAALLVGTVIGIVMQASLDPRAVDPDRAIAEGAAAFVARLRTAAARG